MTAETASGRPRQGDRSDAEMTDGADVTAPGRHSARLALRRAAADRLPPLSCRCRDPWSCYGHAEPIDERTLDAWQAAAAQLVELGFPPLLPPAVRAALGRRLACA